MRRFFSVVTHEFHSVDGAQNDIRDLSERSSEARWKSENVAEYGCYDDGSIHVRTACLIAEIVWICLIEWSWKLEKTAWTDVGGSRRSSI